MCQVFYYWYLEIKRAIHILPQTKLNMREKYGSLPKQLVFLGVKQDETVMYRNSPSTLIDIVQENLVRKQVKEGITKC